MPVTRPLPDIKNGFKILEDLGFEENGIRYALVICKACNKEFKTSVYHINKIKSCGCLPIRKAKVLESEINGFKIIKDLGYVNGSRRAICICKECKKEYEVDPNKLKNRKHCGCMSSRHGHKVCKYAKSHKRLMGAYQHMIGRCYRKNNKDYYNYGKRGIVVCDEWKGNPEVFCKWALENGYTDKLSIDRIDFNKGYSPDNCRWATAETQARNTSRNVLTMELAENMRNDRYNLKMTFHELKVKYKVSHGTVVAVISKRIWN